MKQDPVRVKSLIYESIILGQFLGPREHTRMGSVQYQICCL